MKIKNSKFTLNLSLLLSMNMGFGMQMDDEFNYKLFKKYVYCFTTVITQYFVVLIL